MSKILLYEKKISQIQFRLSVQCEQLSFEISKEIFHLT